MRKRVVLLLLCLVLVVPLSGCLTDARTGALVAIDSVHEEIHEGRHWNIQDTVDLSINNVYDIQITPPVNGKYAHFVFSLSVESETEWYLYEDVTVNTAGTALADWGNNRPITALSSLSAAGIVNATLGDANADTAVGAASELAHGIAGAGKNADFIGHNNERILAPGDVYSLRFVANAAGYVNFLISWYEEDIP